MRDLKPLVTLSGGGEASFGYGSLESPGCQDRQTHGNCVFPESQGQQRHPQLLGNELGEAARPRRKELPPDSQGDHDSQSCFEGLGLI